MTKEQTLAALQQTLRASPDMRPSREFILTWIRDHRCPDTRRKLFRRLFKNTAATVRVPMDYYDKTGPWSTVFKVQGCTYHLAGNYVMARRFYLRLKRLNKGRF